jgi:hypothetical protein
MKNLLAPSSAKRSTPGICRPVGTAGDMCGEVVCVDVKHGMLDLILLPDGYQIHVRSCLRQVYRLYSVVVYPLKSCLHQNSPPSQE